MAYSGLKDYISSLDSSNELVRIKTFVDPVLEIAEITDRVSKAGGKALLFENNGTSFPVLINAFGSEKRMAMAMGKKDLDEAGIEITKVFSSLSGTSGSIYDKLSAIPDLIKLSGILPSRSAKKGKCQQVIYYEPDLGILPVLKCWPYDGNRFITLPMVHTMHPETKKPNVGMYRMQIFDEKTTGMHWQLHKTGANHFEAWKKAGKQMPVSVALGGDPVYTYAATAPLPENFDEYILAGFLRQKKVKLVKCITNDLFVPADADIIIEGYVDPAEDPVWEGPFGDHTGFYSLADWYPGFHITCITHSRNAVYPATIVGIPPQEDSFFAKATEKLFLNPIKLTLNPEITDLHLPDPGVAHNLAVVKINKNYSGQGMKVISSLFGAGQMMFTKYLLVVDEDINIRNYQLLVKSVLANTDFTKDLFYCRGPLDVLDHSSNTFAFGGKLGIDATGKTKDELQGRNKIGTAITDVPDDLIKQLVHKKLVSNYFSGINKYNIPFLILSADTFSDRELINKLRNELKILPWASNFRIVFIVDQNADVNNLYKVAWQVLGNSDPVRDHYPLSDNTLLIDGTLKVFRPGGFARRWPNIVCSDPDTIKAIDNKWYELGIGELINSPSLGNLNLCYPGNEEISL